MNKHRRNIILGGVFALTSPLIFKLSHASNTNNKSIESLRALLKKTYGNKPIIESDVIDIDFGKMRTKVGLTGGNIYFPESAEVVPFGILSNNIKTNGIMLVLQNPKTLENTVIAKYNVNESYAGEVRGRFKHRCKNTMCRAYAVIDTDENILLTSKLLSLAGCYFNEN